MMPKELGSERAAFAPCLFRPTRFFACHAQRQVPVLTSFCLGARPRGNRSALEAKLNALSWFLRKAEAVSRFAVRPLIVAQRP
jgi:hypothetical protein